MVTGRREKVLCSFNLTERESPWVFFRKNIYFAGGQFDEHLVSLSTLNRLTQPVPDFFLASVKKRQAEYLAGRLCAGDAIYRWQGRWLTPGTGADGAPVWPKGIVGSISHCSQSAVSVAMDSQYAHGVGVDLETIIPADQIDVLAKGVLIPREKQRFLMSGKTIQEQQVNLTLVFSLKESLFKAFHPLLGKRFYFEAAEVLSCAIDSVARLRIVDDLSPGLRAGVEINGYACLYKGKALTLIVISS